MFKVGETVLVYAKPYIEDVEDLRYNTYVEARVLSIGEENITIEEIDVLNTNVIPIENVKAVFREGKQIEIEGN